MVRSDCNSGTRLLTRFPLTWETRGAHSPVLLSVSCREHHRACFTWNGGLAMIAAYESRGGGSSDESSREVGIAVAARRRGRGVCAGVRLNAEPSRDCPRLSVAVGLPLRSRSVWCHTRPEYQAWVIPCGGTTPAVMRAFDPSRGVLSDGEQVEPCACESERPPARRSCWASYCCALQARGHSVATRLAGPLVSG